MGCWIVVVLMSSSIGAGVVDEANKSGRSIPSLPGIAVAESARAGLSSLVAHEVAHNFQAAASVEKNAISLAEALVFLLAHDLRLPLQRNEMLPQFLHAIDELPLPQM